MKGKEVIHTNKYNNSMENEHSASVRLAECRWQGRLSEAAPSLRPLPHPSTASRILDIT